METMFCLSCSNYNTPLRMIRLWSNYPILILFSTTLNDAIDLEKYYAQAVFLLVLKKLFSR